MPIALRRLEPSNGGGRDLGGTEGGGKRLVEGAERGTHLLLHRTERLLQPRDERLHRGKRWVGEGGFCCAHHDEAYAARRAAFAITRPQGAAAISVAWRAAHAFSQCVDTALKMGATRASFMLMRKTP